jgi:RHS repeat-associated protein
MYGMLISQVRSAVTRFYLFDALGSCDRLTDTTGTVTDSYVYQAFGSLQTSSGATLNAFRFIGEWGYYNDSDLARYYVRARYQAPRTGSFISPDPFSDARFHDSPGTPYAYARNNPVINIDPSGLTCCRVPITGIIAQVIKHLEETQKPPPGIRKPPLSMFFQQISAIWHGLGADLQRNLLKVLNVLVGRLPALVDIKLCVGTTTRPIGAPACQVCCRITDVNPLVIRRKLPKLTFPVRLLGEVGIEVTGQRVNQYIKPNCKDDGSGADDYATAEVEVTMTFTAAFKLEGFPLVGTYKIPCRTATEGECSVPAEGEAGPPPPRPK